jgi:membrane protein DedA with SNARE-associated domain
MHDWITGLLESGGYFAVAALMLLENVFPPIPSEVIMPLAGYTAGKGELSLPIVILAGSLGSVLGTLPWYGIGHWIGIRRLAAWSRKHGRWLALAPGDVEKAQQWFEKHCTKAVLFGRLIPAVRTLISVPAGVAGMPLPKFLLFSAIGSLVWTAALAAAGSLLGENHAAVERYLGPVTNGILIVLAFGYVYRVVQWKGNVG